VLNRFWGMAEGRVKAAPAQSAPLQGYCLALDQQGPILCRRARGGMLIAAVRFQVVREVFSPDLSAGHQVIGLARIQRLSDGRFQSSSLGWARGARSFRKRAIASGS